jgi:Xylose isomerase-like TIM barrel.
MKAPPVELTMLSGMAGPDIERGLDRYVALGLRLLDLKDRLWGHAIDRLPLPDAERLAGLAAERGLGVYCLSASVGFSDLDDGEAAWRERHEATLAHVLEIAPVLKPQVIRLLAATWRAAPAGEPVLPNVAAHHPWIFGAYREMAERITAAGFQATIENEVHHCILATPDDVTGFFARLEPRLPGLFFTWDVQNLWQMGVFPSLAVYQQLKPLMGGLHLKGGRTGDNGDALVWASDLADASWPVKEIVQAAVADGVAPVICLNPSHGATPEGFDGAAVTERNIAWLRREIEGIAP